MKLQGANIFELLFIGLLFLKGTNTPFFGEVPSFFIVFVPFLMEILFRIIYSFIMFKQWPKKMEFWVWKTVLRSKIKAGVKKARKEVFADLKRSSNPGNFTDPANLGK